MNLSLIIFLTSLLGLATGCCVFNGTAYEEGETIVDACVTLYCNKNECGTYTWAVKSDEINPECDKCCIWNDPHIFTFDHAGYYNWHGTCRYSLAEYIESWGNTNPPPTNFAVYGDFKPCGTALNSPSCVDTTSYQLDALLDNVLHVDHSNVFKIINFDFSEAVSAMDFTHPTPVGIGSVVYNALAWKHNNCLRILGANLLLHICTHSVCIYTSTTNLNHLGGLCGKYNNDMSDDHTDRKNVNHPWNTNVPTFAETWQVASLSTGDTDCKTDGEEFTCKDEELVKYKEVCNKVLTNCIADKIILNNVINACAEDVCAFPKQQNLWLNVALEFCVDQAKNGATGGIKDEPIKG